MNWKLISLCVIVSAAVTYIILERFYPYDENQKLFRKGFWNDMLLYTFLQSYVLGFAIDGLIRWMDHTSGLSRLHLVSAWPLWAQVVFFFVLHDLYIYWFHRAQHRFPVLWRVHEAHHSAEDVDWLAGSRSHSFEIMINQTIEFAPIVLLGGAPEVAIIKGLMDAVWGMYIHSNINVRSGWLQYIINGPEMHRWHHAREITEGGLNFATKIAVWDWLFRTAYLPNRKPKGYGLSDVEFPNNYIAQHLFAFRPFKKAPEAPSASANASNVDSQAIPKSTGDKPAPLVATQGLEPRT